MSYCPSVLDSHENPIEWCCVIDDSLRYQEMFDVEEALSIIATMELVQSKLQAEGAMYAHLPFVKNPMHGE